MAKVLSVGIDLGGDTLKLSYAFEGDGRKIVYGKIEKSEAVLRVAVPAVAYYDGSGWIFGNDVEKGGEKPFINVVKIKTLLSLLFPDMRGGRTVKVNGAEVYPNRQFYYSGSYFPKFFFPTYQKTLGDFSAVISADRAFMARGYTPQSVCTEFFRYVRKVVDEGIVALGRRLGSQFSAIKLAAVYPVKAGRLYEEELASLIAAAFGKRPDKMMNSGRALSMFALERNAVKRDEEILIFDMGEDTLSVMKCFLNDEGWVVVEPQSDHSAPINIGGNDVDFAIADYIENAILRRETVGSPSYGDEGHIQEEGLQSKQYLFLKEIKKAKLLLSVPSLGKIFQKGVPVSLHRDLYLQLSIDTAQLEESVGIKGNNGIAKKILDYILNELKLGVNREVKSIFLTGGLVETCGLLDYIKRGVRAAAPKIVVRTFDDNIDNGDCLTIQTYEDSVYAPSVGAAIVALRNYDVSAGLTYSYGTWMSVGGEKIIVLLVGRGHKFDERSSERLYATCNLQGTLPEEFFSVRLSKSSVRKKVFEDEGIKYIEANGETYLCIGEPGSAQRRKVENKFQLSNISGPRAKISCSYRARTITDCVPRLKIMEGVITHPDSSIMTPFVQKQDCTGSYISVKYADGGIGRVRDTDITVVLDGVASFEGETD